MQAVRRLSSLLPVPQANPPWGELRLKLVVVVVVLNCGIDSLAVLPSTPLNSVSGASEFGCPLPSTIT